MLFPSEQQVRAWCAAKRVAPGQIVPLSKVRDLAYRWYEDWLHPSWRRRTTQETKALFAELGLDHPFWDPMS